MSGAESEDDLVARQAAFAPCPRGLEEALVDELCALGIDGAEATGGGVRFDATWPDVRRANLRSRLASRILVRVASGRYRETGGEEDIHRLARGVDWGRWFDADATLRVDTTAGSGRRKSPLRSLEFVTLRVKDGICDRFRDETGRRPSVDTRAPDVRVFAYLDATTCTLYLDTSGEPLFKRGWRQDAGEAPLRENLAAGLLRLAGWTPGMPLLDPMCGSGTIVVEAAQHALGIAPGARRAFGFERLKNFDPDAWRRLRDDAAPNVDAAAIARAASIRGSDVSGDAVAATRANLVRAGVPADLAATIAPKQIDAREARPQADHGLVVTNPPYGARIDVRGGRTRTEGDPHAADDATTDFYAAFGDTLKRRFAGWTAHVLTSDRDVQKKLRLSPDRRVVLYNGAIECRLFRFPLVAGSHR